MPGPMLRTGGETRRFLWKQLKEYMASLLDLAISITLKHITCGVCGSHHAIDESKYNRAKDKGESWFCPEGHSLVFCDTEVQKLKNQLERSENRNKSLGAVIDRQRETINNKDYQIRAQKAAKTRMKNRIHNGVCPCCNRTFENLARHMKDKHPEFVKE